MTEHYRIYCRQLQSVGPERFRVLLLRDPSGGPDNSELPLHSVENTKRWLPGWDDQILFPSDWESIEVSCVKLRAVDDELSFDTPVVPLGPRWKLFDSLEEFESFGGDARQMSEAFSTTQVDNGSDSPSDSPCIGVLALLECYFSELSLQELAEIEIAEHGEPGARTLAVLSGLVFDLSPGLSSLLSDLANRQNVRFLASGGEPTSITLTMVTDTANSVVNLPLLCEQDEDGCYFNIDATQLPGEIPGALNSWLATRGKVGEPVLERNVQRDLEDWTCVLQRSRGDLPTWPAEILGRFPLLVSLQDLKEPSVMRDPAHVALDVLAPAQFIGELLHYRLDVRDALDRTRAQGEVSVRRARLDPPPLLSAATVHQTSERSARVNLQWTTEEDGLQPFLLYQERPLDPCGYYGTDDDYALEEGLRQSDLNFRPEADSEPPVWDWEGRPATRSLRGQYDQYGLVEVPLPKSASVQSRELSFDWDIPDSHCGYRLYAGLRRPTVSALARDGLTRLCDHYFGNPESEHSARRIFQIERIAPDDGQLHWQDPADFSAQLLEQDRTVRVAVGLPAGEQYRIGGFRVLVRDVLGELDHSPWKIEREFEVVSEPVYRFRPFSHDHGRRLLPLPVSASGALTPAEFPATEPANAFDSLDKELRKHKGSLGRVLDRVEAEHKEVVEAPSLRGHYTEALATELWQQVRQLPKADSLPTDGDDDLSRLVAALEQDDAAGMAVREHIHGHWRLLGFFSAWAKASGYACDVMMPLSAQADKDLPKLLELFGAAGARVLCTLLPSAPDNVGARPWIATVRILLLPSTGAIDNALSDKWRTLMSWALARSDDDRILYFEEDPTSLDLLPMDEAGWTSFAWAGLQDRWHHRLQFAVQQLGRYSRVRDDKTTPVGDPPASHLQTLEVPRLEPAPPCQAITAVNDPYRVAFAIADCAQRQEAAHNALVRMRYGDLSLQVRTSWRFPWSARYQGLDLSVFAAERDNGDRVDDVSRDDVPRWQVRPWEDVVELLDVPFFLAYTLEARWVADDLPGSASSAQWQRRPSQVRDLPDAFTVTRDTDKLIVSIPITCLGDLLSEAEARHVLANTPFDGSTDLLIRHLPDLSMCYRLLYRLESNTYAPLAELQPPELASDEAEIAEDQRPELGYRLEGFDPHRLPITAIEDAAADVKIEGRAFVIILRGAFPEDARERVTLLRVRNELYWMPVQE